MHVCVCHSVHTLSSPSFCSSIPLFLSSFPSLLLAVQLGEAGLESKVQVCRLADESHRGSFPPTVCKYVVTLIERSSSSQQLSFLLLSVCVCMCVCECVCLCEHGPNRSRRRHMALIQITVQQSHVHTTRHNRGKKGLPVHTHAHTPTI